MEEQLEEETSSFNEAKFQIARLNEFWIAAESFANKDKYDSWYLILNSIERELYSDILKLKGSKTILFNLKKFKERFIKSKSLIKVDYKQWGGKRTDIIYVLDNLDNRHKYLKDIQTRTGKGGSYRDKDDEDLE